MVNIFKNVSKSDEITLSAFLIAAVVLGVEVVNPVAVSVIRRFPTGGCRRQIEFSDQDCGQPWTGCGKRLRVLQLVEGS